MRALAHRRFRRAISRYADGELHASTAQALASHLRQCDGCSHNLAVVLAIKDSLGRLADAEPPTLAAARLRRWAANPNGESGAVTRAAGSGAPRRGRERAPVGGVVGVLVAIAAAGALLLYGEGSSRDPGTVAALVELARLEPAALPVAGNVERSRRRLIRSMEVGDRRVSLARHLVDGREVLVATSDRPFSMPADARPLGREQGSPWLARRGEMDVACLSRPTHMLLVGPLPAERLVEIGRSLGPL